MTDQEYENQQSSFLEDTVSSIAECARSNSATGSAIQGYLSNMIDDPSVLLNNAMALYDAVDKRSEIPGIDLQHAYDNYSGKFHLFGLGKEKSYNNAETQFVEDLEAIGLNGEGIVQDGVIDKEEFVHIMGKLGYTLADDAGLDDTVLSTEEGMKHLEAAREFFQENTNFVEKESIINGLALASLTAEKAMKDIHNTLDQNSIDESPEPKAPENDAPSL